VEWNKNRRRGGNGRSKEGKKQWKKQELRKGRIQRKRKKGRQGKS
jgi:hypothetical protein